MEGRYKCKPSVLELELIMGIALLIRALPLSIAEMVLLLHIIKIRHKWLPLISILQVVELVILILDHIRHLLIEFLWNASQRIFN